MDPQQPLPVPRPGDHESPLLGAAGAPTAQPRRRLDGPGGASAGDRRGGARVFRPSAGAAGSETPFRSVARVVTFSPGEGGDGAHGAAPEEAAAGDVDAPPRGSGPPAGSLAVAHPSSGQDGEDSGSWAMMRSFTDGGANGSYNDDDSRDAPHATEGPSQPASTIPVVYHTETPKTVILTASDVMLQQDSPSAMDVFKSNVAELALDDHTAYLRRIYKLERQLFAARSTIERQRRTPQPTSTASPAPATPEPSMPPTLESLLDRNQTLVKEVRFADQTCVELASERDNLWKRLRATEERLEEAQAAHALLTDQVRGSTQVVAQAQLRNDKDMELIVKLQNDKVRDQETIHGLEQELQHARSQLESLKSESSSLTVSALQRGHAELNEDKNAARLVESLQRELELVSKEKTQLENNLDQLSRQYDEVLHKFNNFNENGRISQLPSDSTTTPILCSLGSPDLKVGDQGMSSPDTACFFTPTGETKSCREPYSLFKPQILQQLDGAQQGTAKEETLEAYEVLVVELKKELNELSAQFLSVSDERDRLFRQKEEIEANRLQTEERYMTLRAKVDAMEAETFHRNEQYFGAKTDLEYAPKHIDDKMRLEGASTKNEYCQQELAVLTRDLEDAKARQKQAESDAKNAAAKVASSQNKVDKLKDYIRKLTQKYEEHNAYSEQQSIVIAKLKLLNSKIRREAREITHSYEKRQNDYHQERETWIVERLYLTNQLDEISRALLDMPPKSDLRLPSFT